MQQVGTGERSGRRWRRKRRKGCIGRGRRRSKINRLVVRGDLQEHRIIKTLVTHISLEGREFTVMSLKKKKKSLG